MRENDETNQRTEQIDEASDFADKKRFFRVTHVCPGYSITRIASDFVVLNHHVSMILYKTGLVCYFSSPFIVEEITIEEAERLSKKYK